jgi:hypothetical protein
MRSLSVEWFNPASIRFKISPHDDLRGTKGGGWDVERRHELSGLPKYQAIIERYAEGKPWEETTLFSDIYRRRFETGDTIRGTANMKELIAQYYGRVDSLFETMKRKGFQGGHSMPRLLIGRDGDVFIGNQGNHRLAMAHVLNLSKFAGEVICKHSQAAR